MDLPTETPIIRLDIGAGDKQKDGWLSVGLEDHHDIKTDIRQLPLPDEYADEARAIHVFEHINRWQAEEVLREWFRVIKHGGRFALELPELVRCARAVLDDHPDRNAQFGLFGDPKYCDELMLHRWCYSEDEILVLLKRAGFRRMTFCELTTHGRKRWRDMRIEMIKP